MLRLGAGLGFQLLFPALEGLALEFADL